MVTLSDDVKKVSSRTPDDPIKTFAWMCLSPVERLWLYQKGLEMCFAWQWQISSGQSTKRPPEDPYGWPCIYTECDPLIQCVTSHTQGLHLLIKRRIKKRGPLADLALRIKYSNGEWRADLIRSRRWDQMVRWQVKESGGGGRQKKGGEREWER